MLQCAWVEFPKHPEVTAEKVVEVEIRITICLKTAEGPIISQVGTMLDVFAGIAKTGNATRGTFVASWPDEESVPSGSSEAAGTTGGTTQQKGIDL